MRSATFLVIGVLGIGTLSGCKVGPNYVSPTTKMPAAYREQPATQPAAGAPLDALANDEVRWWRKLNDAQLTSLVERAIVANYSIAIAEARLREARSAREAAQTLLYPEVHANASFMRFRAGDSVLGGMFSNGSNFYQAGFDAVWQVDVFGGIRRQIESAKADEQAVAAGHHGVVLMVASEAARGYLELRGVQRQLEVARATRDEQRKTLAITEDKRRNGLSSDLEVARARTEVESTEAEIPPLEQALREYIHVLSTLIGQEPTALSAELEPVAPIPQFSQQLAVGVPSDLLRRRPDIQAAERRIASATAQVGVTTAELFPKLVLGGAAGFGTPKSQDFFHPDSSGYYATGPFVDWTLFDAGRRKAFVKLSEAQVDAAKADYQDTVLRAFGEVENSLVAVDREQARRAALERLSVSARECANIARGDYERGILDQLTVLDTERQANRADMLLAQSQVAYVVDVVTLYKALGGGWEAAEPSTTQPAKETHDKGQEK
ncbi:MAG TPA: efflux transporter outer membrane subunit [Phycisphaerae bacterium]|nr:efflux transporter outer membrane subunit [Phycisphaerae bacterium]